MKKPAIIFIIAIVLVSAYFFYTSKKKEKEGTTQNKKRKAVQTEEGEEEPSRASQVDEMNGWGSVAEPSRASQVQEFNNWGQPSVQELKTGWGSVAEPSRASQVQEFNNWGTIPQNTYTLPQGVELNSNAQRAGTKIVTQKFINALRPKPVAVVGKAPQALLVKNIQKYQQNGRSIR